MIQIGNLEELQASNIPDLLELVKPELKSRQDLWERYHRKSNLSGLSYTKGKNNTRVTFEKYIVDLASGFLGGKAPTYTVNDTVNKTKINLIRELLDKIVGEKNYKDQVQIILDYITNYNDDATEHYELVKDILMTRGAYELIYENDNNEIVYARLNPLQTVAIWDYAIPSNIIGVVRYWKEKQVDGKDIEKVEIIDKSGSRTYKGSNNKFTEETNNFIANTWKDVPVTVVETDEAIFETVVELIQAYEQLIQNTRNMFQYNDEAKLAISGYEAENTITTVDDNGNVVVNPARQLEDKMILESKTIYFNDGGDAKWIEKNINDQAIQNTLKTYIDLIMMNASVPNTFDLGFTNADNASAIDRKFFNLICATTNTMQQLKKAYLRRWELILDRINLKKSTKFDFRDITVELPYNLPANENELIDMWLKLRDIISDETIISRLPLNLEYQSEKAKMDEETDEAMERNIKRMEAIGGTENEQSVQEDGQTIEGNAEQV